MIRRGRERERVKKSEKRGGKRRGGIGIEMRSATICGLLKRDKRRVNGVYGLLEINKSDYRSQSIGPWKGNNDLSRPTSLYNHTWRNALCALPSVHLHVPQKFPFWCFVWENCTVKHGRAGNLETIPYTITSFTYTTWSTYWVLENLPKTGLFYCSTYCTHLAGSQL